MAQMLSEQERATLKEAAFGAVILVSQAEPGVVGMVRESFAAAGALSHASPLVRDIFRGGGVPDLDGSLAELERRVLPALRESVRILRHKAPEEVGHYTEAVLAACDRAAAGSRQVSGAERVELTKIGDALGVPPDRPR